MTTALGPYLKAIVAGTLAGLGTLYAAQADGVITGQEWTQVAIYTISAAAAIYGVPNTPARQDQPAPPAQQAPAQQAPAQQAPAQQAPAQQAPAQQAPAYLPVAPATQWPAAAIGQANTNAATDAAALAAAAAARTAQQGTPA